MTTIDTNTDINQYYIDNADFPIYITAPVKISLIDNISLNNISQYFIFLSQGITFTGIIQDSYNITINNITNYTGLIQNTEFADCNVNNINLKVNNSTLANTYGWLGGINNYSNFDNCQTDGNLNIPGLNGSLEQSKNGTDGKLGGSGGLIVGDYNYGNISKCITRGYIKNPGGKGGDGWIGDNSSKGTGRTGGSGGPGGSGGLITGNYNSGNITYCITHGTIENFGGNGGNGGNGRKSGGNNNKGKGGIGGIGGTGGSGGSIVGNNSKGNILYCISYGDIINTGGTGGTGGDQGAGSGTKNTNPGGGGNGGLGGSGGGIAGNYFSGSIIQCYTNGNINNSGGTGGNTGISNGNYNIYGGNGGNGGSGGSIAGDNNSGIINSCYSKGYLQNDGGTAGKNTITTTNISSDGLYGSGGLIAGNNCSNLISNCYSNGDIIITRGTNGGAGGIAGIMTDPNLVSVIIDNCYVAGLIPDGVYKISSTYNNNPSSGASHPWTDDEANKYLLVDPITTVWDVTKTPYVLKNV